MSAELLGAFTLGQAIPIGVAAQAQLDAAVGVTLPSLQAQVTGAIAAQAAIALTPPTLATSLSAALDLVANLQAAIAVGLPSASVDLAVMATIVAELQAQLGAIQASAAFSASLSALFGTGGVWLVRADSTIGALGADIGGAVAGVASSSTTAKAVALVAVDEAAWTAISTAMRVS